MTNPRDTEILATAEAWLDGLDPATTPAEDPRELRQIGLAQRNIYAAEAELRRAVQAARDAGYCWSAIGRTLGVTKQAAQERFRHPPGLKANVNRQISSVLDPDGPVVALTAFHIKRPNMRSEILRARRARAAQFATRPNHQNTEKLGKK